MFLCIIKLQHFETNSKNCLFLLKSHLLLSSIILLVLKDHLIFILSFVRISCYRNDKKWLQITIAKILLSREDIFCIYKKIKVLLLFSFVSQITNISLYILINMLLCSSMFRQFLKQTEFLCISFIFTSCRNKATAYIFNLFVWMTFYNVV